MTKTMLFAGDGTDPMFDAYDKETGALIAQIPMPAMQTGLPMTYVHQGRQFILLSVGAANGQGPQMVAYALPAPAPPAWSRRSWWRRTSTCSSGSGRSCCTCSACRRKRRSRRGAHSTERPITRNRTRHLTNTRRDSQSRRVLGFLIVQVPVSKLTAGNGALRILRPVDRAAEAIGPRHMPS